MPVLCSKINNSKLQINSYHFKNENAEKYNILLLSNVWLFIYDLLLLFNGIIDDSTVLY